MPDPIGELLQPKQTKLEKAYHAHLETAKRWGGMREFWCETITLRLGPDCRYTADFLVMRNDGVLELHETKPIGGDKVRAKGAPGFGNDSIVKMRIAAGIFPFPCYIVTPEDRGMTSWHLRRVAWEPVKPSPITIPPETGEPIRATVPASGEIRVNRKVIG